MSSVNWEPVHAWASGYLDRVEDWPMIGTAEWAELPNDDHAKWASVIDAAQHWALRIESNQRAMGDASRAVAAAWDWSKFSIGLHQLQKWRAEHPWSKRETT